MYYVEEYNLEFLELQNIKFSLMIAQIKKKRTNLILQQTLWISISNTNESATFVKLFVHAWRPTTTIPYSSRKSKLLFNDMLTKHEFCAFLGMFYYTKKGSIFLTMLWCGGKTKILLEHSEVTVKMISTFSQSPRSLLKAMLISHAIYTGILFILFHNSNF